MVFPLSTVTNCHHNTGRPSAARFAALAWREESSVTVTGRIMKMPYLDVMRASAVSAHGFLCVSSSMDGHDDALKASLHSSVCVSSKQIDDGGRKLGAFEFFSRAYLARGTYQPQVGIAPSHRFDAR